MNPPGFSTPQGLPRQSSGGRVSPSSAPPLPPRSRRPTDYSHTSPHRPITAGHSLDTGSQYVDTQSNIFPGRGGVTGTARDTNYVDHGPPPIPSRGGHNPTSRQLNYDISNPASPRPRNHTVSSVPNVSSGTYTVLESNNRPMALNRSQPSQDFGNLENQEWYWGNVSKEEVTEVMKDKPDGSFLVRNAARIPGSYTLTLRKDGVNRLIRIMFRDGYYGFAEPLEFRSVVELVDYYSRNSLQPYSHKLDITLQEPVSKLREFEVENEGPMGRFNEAGPVTSDYVSKELKKTEDELKQKNSSYNELSERFEKTTNDISVMRLELAAQDQLIIILKEHLGICEKNQAMDESPDVKQGLSRNLNQLKRRYSTQEYSHKELEAKLHRTEQQKTQLDIERNRLKPIIKELQEKKQQQLRYLNQQGYQSSDVLPESVEEDNPDDDLYATYAMLHTYRADAADYQRLSEQIQKKKRKPPPPPPTQSTLQPSRVHPIPPPIQGSVLISHHQLELPSTLPHFNENLWMRPQISREESKDLLQGKPNGTFLVRPKPDIEDIIPQHEPLHTHTIDIMDDGRFKRIPVFRGPEGGYGFAHPYEFDSLFSLVCYYATNTMQRHNISLQNTALLYPAFLQH